jgi:hypothetical protein
MGVFVSYLWAFSGWLSYSISVIGPSSNPAAARTRTRPVPTTGFLRADITKLLNHVFSITDLVLAQTGHFSILSLAVIFSPCTGLEANKLYYVSKKTQWRFIKPAGSGTRAGGRWQQ